MREIIVWIGTFFALELCVLGFCACRTEEPDFDKVTRGDFNLSLTETGTLETADTKTFVLNRMGRYWGSFKIIGMLEHGTKVQAGDSVIQLDPSEVQKFIVQWEENLENQEAALEKIQVNNAIEFKKLDANLKTEEAAFNLSQLQMTSAQFETEKKQYIKQLQFKQAEIRYEKAKRNIEFRRVVARNDEKIQRIRMEQVKRQVDMAREVLPQLTIYTPISGIFQVGKVRRNTYREIGDNVQIGNSIGSVPDLTWMVVNTCINEVDYAKVKEGMPVTVRLDALPDVEFPGEVSRVGLLCRTYRDDDPRKVFDVKIRLLVSDERLRPGMTVSCEFHCASLKDVLSVPNNCLEKIDGRYYVYPAGAFGQSRVPVTFVQRNHSRSVVEGDLKPGQTLLPVQTLNP